MYRPAFLDDLAAAGDAQTNGLLREGLDVPDPNDVFEFHSPRSTVTTEDQLAPFAAAAAAEEGEPVPGQLMRVCLPYLDPEVLSGRLLAA